MMHDPFVFPQAHEAFWRSFSSAIHLIGVTISAYCLAKRTDKLSSTGLTSHAVSRWLVLLIFLDSWAFIFISGVLVSGVGLSYNRDACTAAIVVCIALYAVSKILIYWFLAERVRLVHPSLSSSRLHSRAYQICLVFVLGYAIIIALAIVGRIAYLRDGNQPIQQTFDRLGAGTDGACVIGIGRPASMALLIYDLLLNVFFTCMFLYPVYRSGKLSPRLRTVAKRTLSAALVALATSAVNICVLTIFHGRELAWMCLASCNADITVNALAIFFVTSCVDEPEEPLHDAAKGAGKQPHVETRCPIMNLLRSITNKLFPSRRPILPISNTGITSSTQGILESSTQTKLGQGVDVTTRTVHFSPRISRLERGYDVENDSQPSSGRGTPAEVQPGGLIDRPPRSMTPPNSIRAMLVAERGILMQGHEPKSTTVTPIPTTMMPHLAASSSSTSGSEEALTRRLPTAIYLQLLELPPPETPEDTTLEIRREGRTSRRRRPPCLISMAVAHARKRSKSVDDGPPVRKDTRGSHVIRGFDDGSEAPTSVEEARNRLRVLSALMDRAGGKKRDKRTNTDSLEVSVITQTDLRVERRQRRRDLLDDYNGTRYDRRGRSYSSSGGL